MNRKLTAAGKESRLRSFQDQGLRDARAVIDLVDAIKPGTVNYDVVSAGGGEEVRWRHF